MGKGGVRPESPVSMLTVLEGEKLKSHEAEDVAEIPDELRNDSLLDLDDEVFPPPSMAWALHESRSQGKRGLKNLLQTPGLLGVQNDLLSVQGRRDNFMGRQWSGPGVLQMAEAGFYFRDGGIASCSFCDITIRGWRSDYCPWSLHKALSPHCVHLLLKGEHGIRPTSSGRRVRSLSYSSFEEMKSGL